MKVEFECEVKIKDDVGQDISFVNDYFSKPKLILTKEELIRAQDAFPKYKRYRALDKSFCNHLVNLSEIKIRNHPSIVRNKLSDIHIFEGSTYSFYQYKFGSVLVKNHSDQIIEFDAQSNVHSRILMQSGIRQPTQDIKVKEKIKRKFNFKSSEIAKLSNISNSLNMPQNYIISKETFVFKQVGEGRVMVKSYIFKTRPTECQFNDNGNLSAITLPIRLGRYDTIFEINDTDIKIKKVYRLPYGLKYDDKKIYGRVVLNKEYELTAILNNGQRLKLKLKPIMSEIYQF